MVNYLGKRGPKQGHGGRPIEYEDPLHEQNRLRTREYLQRKREQPEAAKSLSAIMKEFSVEISLIAAELVEKYKNAPKPVQDRVVKEFRDALFKTLKYWGESE